MRCTFLRAMLEAAESPIIRRLLVAFLAVSCPVVAGCDRIPGRGAAADATAAVADASDIRDATIDAPEEPVS